MAWDEDVRTALVGSPTLGEYVTPTVVDRLLAAVQASFAEIDRLGIRDTVPTHAGADTGPHRAPTSVLDDLVQQTSSRWTFQNGRPRTLAELAAQLEANVAALAAVKPGGGEAPSPLPPGTTEGTLLWAADHSRAANSREAGYRANVQRQIGNGDIQNTDEPVPIVDAPHGMGRALKFTLPDGWKRIEVNPPGEHNSFPNETRWFGFAFALAKGFPLSSQKWSLIGQVHGNDTISPRFAIQVNSGELRVGDTKTICPIQTERRYDVVLKADMAAGVISVWVDGALRLDRYKCGTHRPNGYWKQGWYRDSSVPGGTVYHGPIRIGTGYGAVNPTGR